MFLIKEVKVLNSSLVDEKSLSQFENKNIFLVRLGALIAKITEIPEIKSVRIRKELPSELVFEIEERVPCALFKEDRSLAVSGDGVVFPFRHITGENYPVLVYENRGKESLPLGKSSLGLERAMRTYLAIKDMVTVDTIKIKKETEVFFILENKRTEIRMNSEEPEKNARYLAVLMEQLPSKNVEYIDLRFGEDIPVKP
jgi:cell division septal protein FtsQ